MCGVAPRPIRHRRGIYSDILGLEHSTSFLPYSSSAFLFRLILNKTLCIQSRRYTTSEIGMSLALHQTDNTDQTRNQNIDINTTRYVYNRIVDGGDTVGVSPLRLGRGRAMRSDPVGLSNMPSTLCFGRNILSLLAFSLPVLLLSGSLPS